jgi:DNA-binding transcriptional LysR family regulator
MSSSPAGRLVSVSAAYDKITSLTERALHPMQTSVLRYFLEIVRCQSIRHAADELNIAASALSRHISNLEHEFGVALFERHARGLRLTAAGEVFAAGARQTLRQIERIRSEIDDLRGLRRGHVTIYAVEGVIADFLLPVLAEFSRSYPQVTYDVVVAGTQDVIEALIEDRGDIGITFNPQPNSEIDVAYEAKHPVYVVAAKGHPLAGRSALTVKEFCRLPLGLPDRSFGVRRLLDQTAAQQGISIKPSLTINSIEMAKAYARSGMGLTVLPAFAVVRECAAGDLVAIQIRDAGLTNATVTLCTHRDRGLSSAGQRLLVEISAGLKAFTAENFRLRKRKPVKAAKPAR